MAQYSTGLNKAALLDTYCRDLAYSTLDDLEMTDTTQGAWRDIPVHIAAHMDPVSRVGVGLCPGYL
jgi:hypothetical protein